MERNAITLVKGLFGGGSSLLGVVISTQQVESGLRIASLLVGLAVGVLTLRSLWKNRK